MKAPTFVTTEGDELEVDADVVLRDIEGAQVTAGDAAPERLVYVPGAQRTVMLRTRGSWKSWLMKRVDGSGLTGRATERAQAPEVRAQASAPAAAVSSARPTNRSVARGWCALYMSGLRLVLEFAPWTPTEIRRRYAEQVLGLVRAELGAGTSLKGCHGAMFENELDLLLARDEAAKLLREYGFEIR